MSGSLLRARSTVSRSFWFRWDWGGMRELMTLDSLRVKPLAFASVATTSGGYMYNSMLVTLEHWSGRW